jgi:hypothetical protein
VHTSNKQLAVAKVSGPNFRQNSGNSPDISKGISQSGMSKFESSQVSQAVRQLEIVLPEAGEVPANGGFF